MYTDFSNIYDKVMQDTPYDAFVSYYEEIFEKFNIKPNLILDMGCGTGNITTRLAEKGYDVIGLDSSVDMLSKAREKDKESLYLHMDMTDFELYGTVDAIVSALDCVNYITEDIDKLFALIYNYLNPGGVFVFDINSLYKFHHVFGTEPIIYDDGEIFYVWESEIDETVCHFYITFFIQNEKGEYVRCDEMQTQRMYTPQELTSAAERNGLTVLGVYDAFTFLPPKADSERIFFVIRKEK